MDTSKLLNKFTRKTTKEITPEPEKKPLPAPDSTGQVFGPKMGLINRLIGCSHKDLSRPLTTANITYRTCVNCGARRQFNTDTFETFGDFYCPPVSQL